MNVFFKHTKPSGQLLALFLILVVFFIIGVGVSFLPTMLDVPSMDIVSQAVSQIVIFGGTALFFAYIFHDNPLQFMKFQKPQSAAKSLLGAVLVLLLVMPASDWLSMVNDSMHFPKPLSEVEQLLRQVGERSQSVMEGFLLRNGVGDLLLNLVVLAVVPALCEELFFRGALQQTLDSCFRGNPQVAVWTTAAIFSLMHGEFFAFLPRLLLGLLLGYLFYYGRSIWLNITAHFLNNATVVVLYFLVARDVIDIETAKSLGLPFIIVLVTFVASLLLFNYFFLRKSQGDGNELATEQQQED